MRRRARDCAVLVLVALLPVIAAASEPASGPDTERFRVSAQIRTQSRSDDGRFALTVSARVVPVAGSRDERFALKAVNLPLAACEPLPNGIFADGFEGP